MQQIRASIDKQDIRFRLLAAVTQRTWQPCLARGKQEVRPWGGIVVNYRRLS